MPRLQGVDIPNDRPTVIALTYLYGVGPKTARELCHKAGVNPQAHAREMGEDEVARIAALLTPRPPGLLVLNEPETSLHPDLLPALGRLIAGTAERSQVLVVSHAPTLIDAMQALPECRSITLEKRFGETVVAGEDGPVVSWQWPTR